MADQIKRLSVFIASPGDLPEGERDIVRKVCESLNRTPYLQNNSLFLEPCGYETHVYPGVLEEHPQTDLTRLAEDSDILVAIFHHKLGGAGQNSRSGTVEEIEAALARQRTTGTRPEVLVYFRTVHEELPSDDVIAVNEFKRHLHSRGDIRIRTEDYSDAIHFYGRLFEVLERLIMTQSISLGSPTKLTDIIRNVPQPLLDWPCTIEGQWMERPESVEILDEIHRLINDDPGSRSSTLLLGSPGTGKSALLAHLGKKLREEGVSVFSIKADMVPSRVGTQEEMATELQLPMEASDCLRRLRMDGPVVLIVDQLDAVSEIADRKSERLNLLLNLIKTANAMDCVHVIASCRIFEHRHDVRLATIDAKVITLQPPDWGEIGTILKNYGIDPSSLSQEMKELLEVPLHLKLFIEILPISDGRLDSLHTIQNLYEELWQQKVQYATNAGQRPDLIYQLAKWMSDEEDLWAPSSVADDFPEALQELEAETIIVHEGRKIGFRHQTFFDFVMARRFAGGAESLSQYVLQRQGGLFVRPVLLATLDYLRATSTNRYHRELTDLWRSPSLRKHLVVLLDGKLSSLLDPDEVEQNLILPLFEKPGIDSTRINRLLVSMAGSPGWFKLLQPVILPRYLSLSVREAWPYSTLLIRAWSFAHDHVLHLIETCLLPNPEKDNKMTLSIFAYIDNWDVLAVELVCRIVSRTWSYETSYLAENVSQVAPDLAPKIVRADMERRLEAALQADAEIPEPPPLVKDASEEERVSYWLFDRNKSVKKLFELDTEWYGLSNIAESAPASFLNEIWPWFINVLSRLVHEPNPFIISYQDDSILAPSLGEADDSSREHQPIDAICRAVMALAKEDQDVFLEFLNENRESPFLLVHRLLSRGLVNIAEARPDVVLDYLTADSRRLAIGDFEDKHKESRMLITKVVPCLNALDCKRLEDSILSWSYYAKDQDNSSAEDRQDRLKWSRRHRLRLLRAFPENSLSSEGRRLLQEEERAFPGSPDWDSRMSGVGAVVSPVSYEQMALAKDEHLIALFDELDDSSGWDHPSRRREFVGGVIQASREFGKLAENEPMRVISLMRSFQPGKQETVTGQAIQGLAKSVLGSEELFSLIHELNEAGFVSDSFRTNVADSLAIRARLDHGLPDAMLSILEGWLRDHPEPPSDRVQTNGDQDGSNSILWEHGRMIAFGGGRSQIIDTIAKGYLLRTPADIEQWAGTVARSLEFESHPDVWRIALFEMPPLFNGDKNTATTLFDQVFIRCPQVRDSWEGLYVIARVLRFVTDLGIVRNWLMGIRDSRWPLGKQAFGELLMLWRWYYEDDEWGREQLEQNLVDNSAIEVHRGLAFTASHLWRQWTGCQDMCTEVLLRLTSATDDTIQGAIAEVFRYGETLPLNPSMKNIIEEILPHDSVLIKAAEALIEGIEPHTTAQPDLVFRVCKRVLDVAAQQIGNVATSLFMLAEPLVRISMTLHRMEEPYRSQGLELFEQLLESDINEARQALDLLDRRPTVTGLPFRRPRRRRIT